MANAREDLTHRTTLPRIPTGIAGLDEVIGGGFLKSGVYILQGTPGAGKTILANHLCFNHVAAGGRVVYVTMLAESHARLLQHLQTMSFYDDGAIPESIYYVSAFEALRTGGLSAVVKLLRGEMRSQKASILVLDGLVMAVTVAGAEALKEFVSEIQAHSVLTGCTTLLLTSIEPDKPVTAEQTMVDGILLLRERGFGPRRERDLEVLKLRGASTLRGKHAFRIDADGITVYPRLESARAQSPAAAIGRTGVSTGVLGLDQLIDLRGLPQGSVTLVAGYTGSGKTTLALHFAGQCGTEEPAVYFSFYESPEFLLGIGHTFGLDLTRRHAAGQLRFVWQAYGENILDELAYRLLGSVRRTGARRVVIDGIGGFIAAPAHAERGSSFFASLANELRRLGATTIITAETDDAGAQTLDLPTAGISALADNLIRLRISDLGDQVRRSLSISKMRNSGYDLRIRELRLTARGLAVDRRGPDVGSTDSTDT
jgi:circadian clock protein KaiC